MADFRFALHIIVRDCKDSIESLLESVRPAFDVVAVVDTGSIDGTYDILTALADKWEGSEGAKMRLASMKWPNDFSVARNYALSLVQHDSDAVMWLDADDVVKPDAMLKLRQVVAEYQGQADALLLVYNYAKDANGEIVVRQWRERVVYNPALWEWQLPVHEVLVHKTTDSVVMTQVYGIEIDHNAPVDHVDKLYANKRNWRLLHTHVLRGGALDARTAYYIAHEALDRGMPEYSLFVGKSAAPHCTTGYYAYMLRVGIGNACLRLYEDTHTEVYLLEAEMALSDAIAVSPHRNEARDALVRVYMHKGQIDAAISVASEMADSPPEVASTVAVDMYGAYVPALLAHLHMHNQEPLKALFLVCEALRCARPPVLALTVCESLKQWVAQNDIGFIVVDSHNQRDIAIAQQLRLDLIAHGVVRDVVLSNTADVLMFATGQAWIVSDYATHFEGAYAHPDLIRWAINWCEAAPLGCETTHWNLNKVDIGLLPSVCKSGEFTKTIRAKSVASGLSLAKAYLRWPNARIVISLGEIDAIDADWQVARNGYSHSKVYLRVLPPTNRLVEFHGTASLLSEITHAHTAYNCILAPTLDMFVFEDADPSTAPDAAYSYSIMLHNPSTLLDAYNVAIIANGIELWDGATPYVKGIGASESSVVFLAEELYRLGASVTVFGTPAKPITIAGVRYRHFDEFKRTQSKWSAVIASRCPQALDARYADRQYFWAHDIPEAYAPELLAKSQYDKIVCVSEWQAARFNVVHNVPFSRTTVMYNGVLDEAAPSLSPIPLGDAASVWLSQPERGLTDLLKLRRAMSATSPLLVAYGVYNILTYSRGDLDQVRAVYKLLEELRDDEGVHMLGRVPVQTIRRVLQSVRIWNYPSKFPETFCVAAAECASAGLVCNYTANGATAETLARVQNVSMCQLLELDWKDPQSVADWNAALDRACIDARLLQFSAVPDVYRWSTIARNWADYLLLST